MNRKIILPVMFIVLLAVDLFAKAAVQANMKLYQSIEVVSGLFNITYVLNPGAAFGIFQNQSDLFRKIFFVTITIAACILILVLLYKEFDHKLRSFAYVMVLAGAVGNLVDRIRFEKVVDFLDVYYKSRHWYTFNFADCFITVGVALLLIDMVILNRKRPPK